MSHNKLPAFDNFFGDFDVEKSLDDFDFEKCFDDFHFEKFFDDFDIDKSFYDFKNPYLPSLFDFHYGSDNCIPSCSEDPTDSGDEPWNHRVSAPVAPLSHSGDSTWSKDSGYGSAPSSRKSDDGRSHSESAASSTYTAATVRSVRAKNTVESGYLHCLHAGNCEYQTRRQYDLDRHQKIHFPAEKYDCPGRACGRTGKHGFDRKDHLREHLRKVHGKDIPKQNRRRDPPKDIRRYNADLEAPSELKAQGENYNVSFPEEPIERAEYISRHQKPLEISESIMDSGDTGMPKSWMRSETRISDHTHPVGLSENMAKVKDAAQMNTSGSLVEAVDDQPPHLPHDAQANAKLVRIAPQYDAYVMTLLSLRIELRVWLGRRAPSPTIHISTNGERPLEDGKQRIRWTCRCGRHLYDDFEELRPGALEELEQMLNEQNRVRSPEGNGSGQHRGSSIRALWNAAGGFISSLTGSRPLRNNNVPTLPLHQNHAAGQERNSQCTATSENLFLLMCIPYRKHGTRLVHMNLAELVSDETLFRKLRHEYQSIRGQWASYFSLWKMTEIQFVKFGLHKHQLIDIKEKNDLPPASLKDEYRYQPIPAETIPPIGTNHLMHLYEHPDHADDVPFCLERIPKKIRGQLKLSSHQAPGLLGWGVYFAEGFDWPKFWVFGSVILSLSVLFGACWSTLRQDVQGGFGVTACMMVAVTFTTGVVQAAVEQT